MLKVPIPPAVAFCSCRVCLQGHVGRKERLNVAHGATDISDRAATVPQHLLALQPVYRVNGMRTMRMISLALVLLLSACIYDRMADIKSDMRYLEAQCLTGDSPQACEMYRYKQAELGQLNQQQRQAWQDIGQGFQDMGQTQPRLCRGMSAFDPTKT